MSMYGAIDDPYCYPGTTVPINRRNLRRQAAGSMFCYPEHIARQMKQLFGRLKRERYLKALDPSQFATKAAGFLAELNAIHPFRDGNGRTQLAFMTILALGAGHPLEIEELDPGAFLEAMVASFAGDEDLLVKQLETLIV